MYLFGLLLLVFCSMLHVQVVFFFVSVHVVFANMGWHWCWLVLGLGSCL